MRVSIEWFLLDNWLMNAATLLLAAAFSGFRLKKLGGLLSLLGAVYALLSLWVWPFLLALPLRLIMGAVLALGLCFDGWRGFIRATICVFLGAFLLSGLLIALSAMESNPAEIRYGLVNGIFMGTVRLRILIFALPLCLLLPRFVRHIRSAARISEQHVRVRIKLPGYARTALALLDTGNLLIEPITGLPVMLINDCPAFTLGYPVRYAGLGACGELMARRAKRAQVQISGVWQDIDIMVARAPQTIQGADAIIGNLAMPAQMPLTPH